MEKINSILKALDNFHLNLLKEFERTGSTTALENAVKVLKFAVNITPAGHPLLTNFPANLGLALHRSFEETGSVDDLNEAYQIESWNHRWLVSRIRLIKPMGTLSYWIIVYFPNQLGARLIDICVPVMITNGLGFSMKV